MHSCRAQYCRPCGRKLRRRSLIGPKVIDHQFRQLLKKNINDNSSTSKIVHVMVEKKLFSRLQYLRQAKISEVKRAYYRRHTVVCGFYASRFPMGEWAERMSEKPLAETANEAWT
ncbi:unnamed protein product [Polarella glacialis]|uniref:Uncharacterized protein n=1 Tax=Polarella glacialis TaxID=89957 RepID=A0A813LIH3_POLGL|nr:unnamed protein product [Polarella glacialis]